MSVKRMRHCQGGQEKNSWWEWNGGGRLETGWTGLKPFLCPHLGVIMPLSPTLMLSMQVLFYLTFSTEITYQTNGTSLLLPLKLCFQT